MGPFAKGGLAKKKAVADRTRITPIPRPKTARVAAADQPIKPEQLKFFETKIRPVLVTQCAKCHASGAEKVKGGLLVDSRDGLRQGGDTGPAVVPGNPDESLLITAIRYKDDSLQMPPKTKLARRRSSPISRSGSRWGHPTRAAAPVRRRWPRDQASTSTKGRQFWAFQPPTARRRRRCQRRDLAEVGYRSLPAVGSRGQGPEAGRRRRPPRLDSPGQLRPDRPAPVSRGGRGVRRRYVGRRLREGRRPAAGLAAVRRALGAALARPGAVRRIERQRQHDVSPGLAIPRLGYRRVQRRQAL